MSAREQARAAATVVAEEALTHQRWEGTEDAEFVRPFADAASDVWEPLLQEALAIADRSHHDGHWAIEGCATCDAIKRLKEALA